MDKQAKAEEAFERVWENFRNDKARLRTLNEKEKEELKALMKTVFLSSMVSGGIASDVQEINLKLEGDIKSGEVESTVRQVLKEELGGLTGLLEDIKNRPVETRFVETGRSGVSSPMDSPAVALHESMFSADMNTNIDNVNVDGGDVESVAGNLSALRKLQQKKEEE